MGSPNHLSFSDTASIVLLFLCMKNDMLADTSNAFDVIWAMSILLQLQSSLLEIITDPMVTHHLNVKRTVKAMTNKDFFLGRMPLYLQTAISAN